MRVTQAQSVPHAAERRVHHNRLAQEVLARLQGRGRARDERVEGPRHAHVGDQVVERWRQVCARVRLGEAAARRRSALRPS